MEEKNQLLEKWAEIVDTDKAPAVTNREGMAQLLESQDQYITETASQSSDMAQYTPILMPAVRRIFPNLLANEVVGVQPMNAPTGYAYALRYAYGGVTDPNNAAGGTTGVSSTDRGKFDRSLGGADQSFVTFAILASDPAFVFGANITAIAGNNVTVPVKYSESGKALLTTPAASAYAFFTVGATGTTTGGGSFQIVAVFDNEAGYNLIFKNYSGPVTTAAGEVLDQTSMKSMKMSLERVAIEAQTRKLKAEYTIELAQDLKNVHGLDAEKELINILEYEISAELDRELVDLMNSKATVCRSWSYGSAGQQAANNASPINSADGRWEQEKFRTLYTRILRESSQIALATRRGQGNILIVSANVAAALESLPGFMYASVPGNVKPTLGVAKIGTLDGRFTVYLDTFATSDYVNVVYKGTSAMDTGIIYCPYVPLMLMKVTDPNTFQPKIAFMTRDAICGNLFGVEKYMRKFAVDFTGSSLQGNYWGNFSA